MPPPTLLRTPSQDTLIFSPLATVPRPTPHTGRRKLTTSPPMPPPTSTRRYSSTSMATAPKPSSLSPPHLLRPTTTPAALAPHTLSIPSSSLTSPSSRTIPLPRPLACPPGSSTRPGSSTTLPVMGVTSIFKCQSRKPRRMCAACARVWARRERSGLRVSIRAHLRSAGLRRGRFWRARR